MTHRPLQACRTVDATVTGEDKEIGVVEETFATTPGSTHTIKVDLPVRSRSVHSCRFRR